MKLTDAQREAIRGEYAAGGVSHRALAVKYGCSSATVARTVNPAVAERQREFDKAWYAANPERKRETSKARYAANRERERKRSKAYRERDPERHRASSTRPGRRPTASATPSAISIPARPGARPTPSAIAPSFNGTAPTAWPPPGRVGPPRY